MYVYHVATPDAVEDIMKNGLVRTSRGDKGDKDAIIKTDMFLDARRPHDLQQAGVSRDNNLYAYLEHDGNVHDIIDGSLVTVDEFIKNNSQAVMRLDVDPTRCYVSDIDAYDELKKAIDHGMNETICNKLSERYWSGLILLADYDLSQPVISRPEIVITYDIEPHRITLST